MAGDAKAGNRDQLARSPIRRGVPERDRLHRGAEGLRGRTPRHAAIAALYGYRVSVHSGSDKFSIFPSIGRICGGRFHLKTAGTSWLEALRVVAAVDPGLFGELYSLALARFSTARALYHVTPDLSTLPDPEGLTPGEGPRAARRCERAPRSAITYGEMLAVPDLKRRMYALLRTHEREYEQVLHDTSVGTWPAVFPPRGRLMRVRGRIAGQARSRELTLDGSLITEMGCVEGGSRRRAAPG